MEPFMIATTKIMSTKTHFLLHLITSLGWITAPQMQQPPFCVLFRPTNGLKSVSKRNITMIQLRRVDPKQTRNLSEISRILSVIETYLQFMWILPQRRLKLHYGKKSYPYLMQTTMSYWALKYALNLSVERTS